MSAMAAARHGSGEPCESQTESAGSTTNGAGLPFVWMVPLLIIACTLFGLASYPTVEGWGLWCQWDQEGLGNYLKELPTHPDRPLHLLPSVTAWLLPGDYGWGCMELGGLMALCRGWLLWNLGSMLRMDWQSCLLMVTLGLFEPMWPGCGYERFHAAQASLLCLLGALNLGAWHARNGGWWKLLIGVLLSLAGFMTYQGLFLVSLGAPFAFWVLGMRPVARSLALILLTACTSYLCWYLITALFFRAGYVAKHSESLAAHQLVTRLWAAIIKGRMLTFVSFGITLSFLIGFQRDILNRGRMGWLLVLVLSAPLFGLIFFKNPVWLSDPERVWLPVSVWLVVLAAGWAAPSGSKSWRFTRCWVPALLACGLLSTLQALRYVHLQHAVLGVLEAESAGWEKGLPVRVVDTTDELGQLYTFLAPHHLNMAWRAKGHSGNLVIENHRVESTLGVKTNRVVLVKERKHPFWPEQWSAKLDP